MKKGIVMEIDDAFLTLLTPEGEFLRARRQEHPYVIGEEIHFFPIGSVNTPRSLNLLKNIFKVKAVWAVMAALFIFLGSFIPMYQNNNAYAYMSIDVNPSIELGVNKKMQVVQLTGFNNEGKQVISQLDDWKKSDVSELTQTILAEIKKEGFLKENQHVIISTVLTKEPKKSIEKKLHENIEAIKATVNNQKIEVTVLTATEKELEKAHKLGITTGKYQENKSQETIQKTNEKLIKEEIKKQNINKNAVPSQPENPTSPGQLKKQTENDNGQNMGSVEREKQSNNNWGRNQLAPGHLKKQVEEQNKQNYGQIKRQYNQKEKPNYNYKSKNNENQDGRHNDNHNERHNDTHNDNNRNQDN